MSKEPGDNMMRGKGGGIGGRERESAMGCGNVIGVVIGSSVGETVGGVVVMWLVALTKPLVRATK